MVGDDIGGQNLWTGSVNSFYFCALGLGFIIHHYSKNFRRLRELVKLLPQLCCFVYTKAEGTDWYSFCQITLLGDFV